MLFPKAMERSAYDVDYEKLYSIGYRGIIFDIDNTLVEHGAPANARAIELFNRLKALGFKVCLLSNNKEERVKMFNDDVNVFYIYKAGKPLRKGYVRAMEIMETDTTNTVSIGDQIFTDTVGANNAGINSILVGRIANHEEIQIVLKRFLEFFVLLFYKVSGKHKKKFY
ncbi:MAG: YqeG family HAD IIIA-type phosphatase [Lachnospiraceae bacterium]|nr:YqeG family HAD IIIA-type phosphatase [Lachnospiraceae bacterium]